MALPVAVAVGALVVSAASQLYAAEKQGQISREEAKRQRELLKEYERDVSKLAPGEVAPQISYEKFVKLKDYFPQIAEFYEQQAPELVTESASSKEKAVQRKALSKYEQLADQGDDAISRGAREKALFESDAAAKQRRATLLRQMAESGLGASGQGVLAGLVGGQQEDQAQRMASIEADAAAQQRRLQALDNMTNLAGSMRTANTNVESKNRDIMNQFMQNTANAKNLYNQYVANTNNEAQKFNIGQNQQIANMNTDLMNTQTRENLALKLAREEARRNWYKGIADAKIGRQSTIIGGEAEAARKQQGDYAQAAGTTATGLANIYAGQRAEDTEERRHKEKLAAGKGY